MSDQWDGDVGHEERYLLNLLEDDRLTRDDLSRAMNRIRYRMMSRITPPEAMSLAVRQYRWRLIGTSAWGGWFDGNPPAELHDTQTEIERRSLYARPAPEGKDAEGAHPLTFTYCNWRGETAERTVQPVGLRYGATEWHPEPQWLLRAYDVDKQAEREFAVRDIQWQPPTPAPAASDELVERLRTFAQPTDFYVGILHEAAARIEANAAEMERKDARIAELERKLADTLGACKRLGERATAAEAERDKLKAEVERKDKALREAGEAIAEYFRYLNGGETRGSYDGKPEREGLRKAGYAVSRALSPAKAGG